MKGLAKMKRHRHTREQIVRHSARRRAALNEGQDLTGAPARDSRGHLEPLAEPVRRDEGR